MEKISVYAPIDGEIDLIENLNDGVFSEKMLGDGFFIKPEKNKEVIFYSPIDKGKISLITDTKHAFFFEQNGSNILMHIGLDTVSLNGLPFEVEVQLNQNVSLETKIVKTDIAMIEKSGLNAFCPITIDGGDKQFKFDLLNKSKKVKRGELVGEFTLIETVEKKVKVVQNFKDFFSEDNTYRKVAKKINKLVGGPNNYDEVFNCMTRLRFKVKDVDQVDVDGIKKVELVKGMVWNGKQLQIIIGQDVYKVKDQVVLLNREGNSNLITNKSKNALPWHLKFLAMFSGIMVPMIPAFIGFGLFQAILGILSYESIGVVPPEVISGNITNQTNVGWITLFVISKSSLIFMGIIVAYNAGNYFDFNRPMAVALGLVLCSPLMFGPNGGGPIKQGMTWVLFQGGALNSGIPVIDGIPGAGVLPINVFAIGPQYTKIFVVIATIYLAKKIDNWVITWIPPQVELTFRWFIVIGLSAVPGFFVFGPMWFYLEKVLGIIFYFLAKAPIGIGIGIIGAIWQPAVLFGAHPAIGILFMVDAISNSGFGHFNAVSHIAVWSQFGAVLGVSIVTKNAATRRDANSFAIAGVFGITEPILFGINLPKRRPLFAGVVAAFIACMIAGILEITGRVGSGLGIFEIIGYFSSQSGFGANASDLGYLDGLKNGLFLILCDGISIGLGIGLTILMYKERVSEKKQLVKNDKLFVKYLLAKNYIDEAQAQKLANDLTAISALISKEDEKKLKTIEKLYQKMNKAQDQLTHAETKMIVHKDKFVLRGKKLLQRNQDKKAELLYAKYDIEPFENKIKLLKDEKNKIYGQINDTFVYEFQNNLYDKYQKVINKMKALNDLEKDAINRRYKSILNSLRIAYRLDDFDDAEMKFSKEISTLNKEKKLALKANK
ncbi:PTS glucose transporter subunit IIA [Williamsoniiplasma lucivorax]|uniref:PTS system, beta-glucoside-specific IIABC component n=1 Tax=Williamsoniiplasma lucivorax TaxID=209274 RepID=A0A2S5RDA6_9MOLU|nr:PTS glucose transporter subunit IIA [Williamsoniiplasma lucivorax]PPE05306.1 PTS system, beta-glucoside-specific IIABC component [Williamsoniiplasma lucivorax]